MITVTKRQNLNILTIIVFIKLVVTNNALLYVNIVKFIYNTLDFIILFDITFLKMKKQIMRGLKH